MRLNSVNAALDGHRVLVARRRRCCTTAVSRMDPRRRGVSLIELMVVISIITFLMGMVGVVFHRMFLSEQILMRTALTEHTVSRLSVQFRSDVHASNRVTPLATNGDSNLQGWLLSSSESEAVRYSVRDEEVIREKLVDGKARSREVFRLPICHTKAVDPENVGTVEMIGLAVERQGSAVTPHPQAERPWRTMLIEAALGHDSRLAASFLSKGSESPREEQK